MARGLVLLLWLTTATHCARAGAAEDDKPDEAGRARRLEKMKRAAAQYTLFSGDDRKRPLDFVETPVMRWTNPENLAKDGTIFLWTRSGRPQAVLGLYTYDDDHFSREWQSLAEETLTAERGNDVEWSPAKPGIRFASVKDFEAPAPTAAARLRQMKALAARFSSTFVNFAEKEKPLELRLLPQPLYRYAAGDDRRPDGAMFAFVQGTDPQSLLVLEARGEGTTSQWHYAFARMASGTVTGSYDGREVFSVPRYDFQKRDPRKPFFHPAPEK